jgi:hypothetical protein
MSDSRKPPDDAAGEDTSGFGPDDDTDVGRVLIEEETEFDETPITAVVGDMPELRAASAAGHAEEALFTAEPPDDDPVTSLAEPLPEMAPAIWNDGLRALIDVPDTAPAVWPGDDYWKQLEKLYIDEAGVADTAGAQVELTLAAARVAEVGANPEAAGQFYEDALTLAPDAVEALRGRARLCEATADLAGAHAAWARLAAVVTEPAERAFYAALAAEWTLAREGDLEEAALEHIPDGLPRLLAAAEVALLKGSPGEAAEALEQAGFAAGGALGAALLESAARSHEVGADPATAAERRFVASRMDPNAADAVPLGRLRDAARLDPQASEALLVELLPAFAPSALGGALARWAAALARQRGDLGRAGALLADAEAAGAASPAVVRDRIDLAALAGAPVGEEMIERARATLGVSPASATLALVEASGLAGAGELASALGCLGRGIEETPDAVPLGILAEEIARATPDPALKVAGFDLWLRADPGRRPEAALALAEALEAQAAGDPGRELAVRAALQTALEAAPGGAVFWTTAAHDVRAGRLSDAAAMLEYGAELWGPSRLGPALHARAAELAAFAAGLPAGPRGAPADADASGRAAGALARAFAASDGVERRAALEAALAEVPEQPVALALMMDDPELPAARGAEALWAAAGPAGMPGLRLAAALWAAASGDGARALALARALYEAEPGSRPARDLLLRAVSAAADGGRDRAAAAAVVAALPPPGEPGDDAGAFVWAEALGAGAAAGDRARAAQALSALRGGRLGADARRALVRLDAAPPEEGLPLGPLARALDREAEAATRALGRLAAAARDGRWSDAIDVLEREPPHEESATGPTLYAAGLLAEGRGLSARAPLLFVAAMIAGPGEQGAAPRLSATVRAAEADVGPGARASALEAAAAQLDVSDEDTPVEPVEIRGGPGLASTVATLLCRAAAERAREGDAETVERRLREAVIADPAHLPAAVGVRRAAARRGDVPATIEAAAHEATILHGTGPRVATFMRAAALARGAGQGEAGHRRTVELVGAALASAPGDDAAFDELRGLLEESGDHAALAAALSARIAVARNPFELTALRLARTDLLAGPLGDRAAAKSELHTILQKEPQHGRALARLGDLEYEDHNFAEAGELYLRRAMVERSPAELHELHLRLGRIYTHHVPDAKRAAGAYARVIQTEPDCYEALAALSEIYVTTGETKSALAVTEQLTAVEKDPVRRTAALVRAGQLWERTGDLRQAGARFRRAADEAPRDLAAVSELARFLERTRDLGGRRALLDHAVGLLRHDVERGRFDVGTLRTLAPLLQARGKRFSAAAAAQLVGALSSEVADRDAASTWAAPPTRGRRLTGLAQPEIDDRSFPPALPPGIRHIFRLVGPSLRRGPADVSRLGLARADRLGKGQHPREVVDALAAELGVREVDVYVHGGRGDPAGAIRVEPGDPSAIILGWPIQDLGARAARFASGRALRLVATHLDLVLAATPLEAGALLGGVIRQFVPEYRHPEIKDEDLESETARIGKLLSRKVRQEVMPFAIESAGEFDLSALHAAVRDGANGTGLLACGDLPAALAVLLRQSLTVHAIGSQPEALALLRFALSDDYDDMARASEE